MATDKEIQDEIIKQLKGRPHRLKRELEDVVAAELHTGHQDVDRIFGEMADRNEAGYYRNDHDLVRLTNNGKSLTRPSYKKVFDYIASHWIAIAALILSIIGLFKDK